MTDDDLWAIERGFWTEGRAHYERHWSPRAVAVFPAPMGVMAGDGFVADLPEAGAWQSVEIEDGTLARPAEGVAVLGYRATGTRAGAAYRCYCSSTYLRTDETWAMVQHQQTPVAGG